MNVDEIKNGVVIDHIPAGKGLEIYRLLNLENARESVALLQNVRSEKYGCKDLIKIEGENIPEQLDILGYLCPDITLIIINGGKVTRKYRPAPPEKLVDVIRCKNPRCISSAENCASVFIRTASGNYRCKYCDSEFRPSKVQIQENIKFELNRE
jgi:aspartate carbamoyltransferase regulatory subunit